MKDLESFSKTFEIIEDQNLDQESFKKQKQAPLETQQETRPGQFGPSTKTANLTE